ncbi:QacE family quaternary ammonium compound efflux SMR transporter [Bacillus atrophaeus]|jgi:paired small multidrug resistance pump|uniref:Efflux transporter n=1 Tax=Bacillus atrophaeus (strain 1942) TaxID=720555 RepID=A0ABN3ZAW2_BACA1|nr:MULTISPECIES: multidrug efflux SMR transporter [Bacillus]AMR63268.1 multidrug resistance protein SMR [Bacillus subtilis subsp. globigii]MBT2624648.1 multidrug efflux SMR transporter [Bacillus sp. ISL-32]ADP31802.1 efflux transporter [Bacillus atrophaeus 1942]AIK47727.1 multidrug resistance protein ykkD [Bacillus atrophaeus subsp. globigii]AKL84067.1 YkkD [Bacillus atrophaeus UCMB-5137]
MAAWISLLFAGLLEMLGVTLMNQFQKDKSLKWLLCIIVGFAASFSLLSYAMETIPMGTAYAVWTGIGAAGGALVGILFYGEPKDAKRIFFIALILSSAVGLKILS